VGRRTCSYGRRNGGVNSATTSDTSSKGVEQPNTSQCMERLNPNTSQCIERLDSCMAGTHNSSAIQARRGARAANLDDDQPKQDHFGEQEPVRTIRTETGDEIAESRSPASAVADKNRGAIAPSSERPGPRYLNWCGVPRAGKKGGSYRLATCKRHWETRR
jgi:hypothetical protein